jgi:Zn-dependent peptidase ImmA (M78 family)
MNFDYSLAEVRARKVLEELGLDSPVGIPLQDIVFGRGAFYEEKVLKGKEGQIVSLDDNSIITINSNIDLEARKRFTTAHELGHYEMHRKISPLFTDTEENLLHWYQEDSHEKEANEFAAEFLMPSELFYAEAKRACGNDRREIRENGVNIPQVIDHLSAKFQISQTAALLRFAKRGNIPVMVVCSKESKIQWFAKPDDFPHYILGTRIPLRPESVAYEAFNEDRVYSGVNRKQRIMKSAWFFTNDRDMDDEFFEYCLYAKNYGYAISIIWEK